MKTPMQKLIDYLSPEQHGIKLIAQDLLEEEKKMIEKSYEDGNVHGRDKRKVLNYYYMQYVKPNESSNIPQ